MRAERLLAAAGLCDLATGLALIAAPGLVVAALDLVGGAGVIEPAGGGVFLRWVGAFVAAVGASYLYPWTLSRSGSRERRARRLVTVAEVTALQRAAIALFVTCAVALGPLGPGWLAVALFDGAVAAAQVAWLARGGVRD